MPLEEEEGYEERQSHFLSPEQIHTFLTDGVLVVDNVLSSDEIQTALSGLHDTLLHKYSIDTNDLYNTGHYLTTKLSSTNGSGGVLDLYYEPWQIQVFASNTKLFHMTTELWKHMYCYKSSDPDDVSISSYKDIPPVQQVKWHPYGSFDHRKGYMYLDRIGYRLPTQLAYDIAEKQQRQPQEKIDTGDGTTTTSVSSTSPNNNKKKKKKVFPIQRSLTPHFDCCPSTMYNQSHNSIKWRPIQCFISLTDTLEPNHGGFEAVKGFHHEFHAWSQPPTPTTTTTTTVAPPAPCIGEYAHLRPKEDHDIYQRIEHIPVSAGSAVFWDNRIPHANAYRHDGTLPRAVVYCSFLPDVSINRQYVQQQLQYWKDGRFPSGNQWIKHSDYNTTSTTAASIEGHVANATKVSNNDAQYQSLSQYQNILQILPTPLARRLAGIDDWE